MTAQELSLGKSVALFAGISWTDPLVTRYIPLGLLTVLLLASLLKAVRVWEEIHDVEEPDSPSDLLTSFIQAHAAGELDDAELRESARGWAESPPTAGKAEPGARLGVTSTPAGLAPPEYAPRCRRLRKPDLRGRGDRTVASSA